MGFILRPEDLINQLISSFLYSTVSVERIKTELNAKKYSYGDI